jgi:RNA polymerase sigma-70 factor (ECF subfamily)
MSFVRSVASPEPNAASAPEAPAMGVPSFEELYETHFSFVWRMLRRLGVRNENAADATQDVFLVVGRRLSDLHSVEAVRSWIYGIVVRVAHEYRRAQVKAVQQGGEPDQLLDPGARSAHEAVEHAEEVEVLDRLLSGLDADKREVLVLVELEQLSAPEVAKLTGVNLNTVYTRLRAARAAFNDAVERHRARTRRRP